MKKTLINIPVIASLFLMASCSTEKDEISAEKFKQQLAESYLYYPIALGNSWTYQIDSIYYSDNLGNIEIDTVSGLYRETLTDTFRTEDNSLIYRCIKEKKDAASGAWNVLRTYSLMLLERQLVRTEENTPLIDLIFPLNDQSSWDPCAYIDANANFLVRGKGIQLFKDWPPSYVERITQENVLGQDRKIAEVTDIEPDDNIILYQSSKRRYAQGLGLIYKEQSFFTTQKTELADSPWEEKAEIGFKSYQTLIEFKQK